MKRQTLKRLIVKGTVAYVAVFSLLLMVAMPAIAVMAANSINSRAIIDRTIRARDIRDKAVKGNKIGKRVIVSKHVKSIKDKKIAYSKKTRVLTIPAAAFHPDTMTNWIGNNSNRTGATTMTAPVQLPDGAKVIKVKVLVTDTTVGVTSTGALLSATDAQSELGTFSTMASASTPGASTAWTYLSTKAITSPVISNATKQYFVQVYPKVPGALFTIARIRIKYQIAGP